MNCYNAETKLVHENLYNEKRKNASEVPLLFTAPIELNTYELSEVGYDTIIAYSYIDTMVTANCLRKNTDIRRGELREPACKYKFNYEKIQDFSSYIIDRKGKKLHYKTYCKYCYNKIFNVEPLYLLDKIEEFLPKICRDELSEPDIRIDFSFESDKEVRNILNKKIPESFTRGHIKTSIK
jgi:putative protease